MLYTQQINFNLPQLYLVGSDLNTGASKNICMAEQSFICFCILVKQFFNAQPSSNKYFIRAAILHCNIKILHLNL